MNVIFVISVWPHSHSLQYFYRELYFVLLISLNKAKLKLNKFVLYMNIKIPTNFQFETSEPGLTRTLVKQEMIH